MPFPRPAARPWGGFTPPLTEQPNPPPQRPLRRLMRKAHAAERAAALAYRGHRTCFTGAQGRRQLHRIAMDEWRHRAWLRQRLMPVLQTRPQLITELYFALIGATIALACLLLGPFVATYFAGRLERDNEHEYHHLARLVRQHPDQQAVAKLLPIIEHMALIERRHERDLLALIRQHPWLPTMAAIWHWPRLRTPMATTPHPQYTVTNTGGQTWQRGLLLQH